MADAASHAPAAPRSLMTAPESTVLTCGASGGVTKAGTPCRVSMNLSSTTGRCAFHDPERVAEVHEMRAKGGVAAAQAKRKVKTADPATVPSNPRTLDDAVAYASWLTRAVCVGAIDARTAESSTKALALFSSSVAKRELQHEVKALRAQLDALKGKEPRRAS